ncbi:hypothetical protein RIEPE_0087 [Candidatus Riesia pediculicola USDA]|uniref:Uncharacterized protein n=1 Tax=Riesia pediculicola (strain USDA) TaxID=515618 RepID=D4G7P9_RIEPU|nr:hypothetical protein RIEPE_0087 [Candidatus Riesia pediculicola USDA]
MINLLEKLNQTSRNSQKNYCIDLFIIHWKKIFYEFGQTL